MISRARLVETLLPPRARGLVLVLHGGAARPDTPGVSATQPSVLRMVPVAARVAVAGRGRLAVVRLLNSSRGWDSGHTPVDDVRWALDRLGERLGRDLPTCLVGHSLGGRAALLAADRPDVRSVVALNPWVYPGDGVALPGRRVLVVHGTEDRVARPDSALAVARRLSGTAEVGYVSVAGGTHAMLRRHAVFDGLAADFARATLLGAEVGGAVGAILAGRTHVEV